MTDSTLNIKIDSKKAERDLGRLNRALDKTEKEGNQAAKSVKKTGIAAKEASKGFGFLGGAIAAVFSVGALAGLTRTIATFEKLEFSLGIVFQSMDRGKQVFKDIQTLALETPFSVEQLTESVIKLRASGIEPTTAQLRLFSDTASVSADSVGTLQAITDLFARTTSGGLGLEDLNRLMDRGIPVFSIFEEKLGLARLEVSEIGKTAEGAAMLLDALTEGLEERFGGAAKEAAGLLANEISNLGVAWDLFLKEIGDSGALDLLTAAIAKTSEVINWMTENIDTVSVALSGMATLVIPAVIKAIHALTLAIAANPIGLIVVAISTGIAALYHFREVIYQTLIRVWEVTLPNAIDHALIAFVKIDRAMGRLVNVVLNKIAELANGLIRNTPDWLKGWLGIDGEEIELKINLNTFDKAIDNLEARISNRIKNFKKPETPEWLAIDPETEDSKVKGLSTSGSRVGDSTKKDIPTVVDQAFSKEQERLLRSFEALESSLLNEEERLFESYAKRQFMVEEAFEAELIGQERRNEIMLALKTQYEEALTKIEQDGWTKRQVFAAKSTQEQTKQVVGEMVNLTAGVAQHNKAMFEINKVSGIANAIISTHAGITKTLETYPWPLAGALAALHGAAGFAQVDAIRSTSFSGGGSGTAPSGATGGAGAPNAEIIQPIADQQQEDTGRQIVIHIDGNVYANDDFRAAMVEALEVAQQNDEVIIHAS